MYLNFFRSAYIIFFVLLSSCRRYVDIPAPVNQLVSSNIYSSNSTAASVLVGLYSNMNNGSNQFASYFGYLAGLSADELVNFQPNNITLSQYYKNALISTSVPLWTEIYQKYIYICNNVIEGLPNSSVSTIVSQQLLGEAKFIRAFMYFYLVNQWGDVPLLTSTDYKVNSMVFRSPVQKVYDQIVSDLKDAQTLLNSSYIGPDAITITNERTIPNKWVATALLARVYLYQGKYQDAQSEASSVINNTDMYEMVQNLNGVFLANSTEAIWQLQPVQPNYNSYEATYYILKSKPGGINNPVALSPFLFNSFEDGDNRKTAWISAYITTDTIFYYPYKYKVAFPATSITEYPTVLRLAEQYLIRAEAEVAQNNLTDAALDLNIIRHRAGLADTTSESQAGLMGLILHERQVELFTEWGHRWLDLKRTKQVNSVMSVICPLKGGVWSNDWALYPIPFNDIRTDVNLIQNPGYN